MRNSASRRLGGSIQAAFGALMFLAFVHVLPTCAVAEEATERVTPAVRVLVAYYSRSGNTEQVARSVADGAGRLANTTVQLKPVLEVTKEDLEAADAIALGTATYFANIPGEMKVALDDWNWKWGVDFTDKVGGAFSTGGGQAGGKEFVIVSLLLFMVNNRMIVAGPLYEDADGEDIWGETGASAMTGPLDPGVSEKELDGALRLGHRLATVARKLKAE